MVTRILALVLALFMASAAMAEQSAELPAQIGRVAAISGAVTYQPGADAAVTAAANNFPLTTGSRIATPPRAHATIDFAAGRFYLDGDSAVTIGALAPGTATLKLEKGAIILRILPGGAGQVFVIDTPRGKLRADQPGYFEAEIAADTGAVSVSALDGGAQFNETTVLAPGMRVTVAQDQPPVLTAAVEDDFIRRISAEVTQADENKIAAPTHVSPQATGFQDLRDGLWISTERYGWVWEPQVMSDWKPFHDGRWVEIAPWGRTWIDDASWGFATSHYGSWTEVNDRWVWVPGNAAQTVASFFDTSGESGARWISLGPEESHPSSSPVIINNVRVISPPPPPKIVNVTTVHNTTNVTTVVRERRQPGFAFFPPRFPPAPPTPPSPPPSRPSGIPNLSGLGATGAPMQPGVSFPGTR